MIVHVNGRAIVGPGVDLRETTIAAEEVRNAVYAGPEGTQRIAIECVDPGVAHEHVAVVRPDMAFRTRTALAAAARSRGLETPHDEQLAELRDRLDGMGAAETAAETGTAAETEMRSKTGFEPETTGSEARRTLDATEREIEELRHRSAALRGWVRTFEETDTDADAARASFRKANGALADAETRHVAAEQRLERHRDELRRVHDRRERRLRLEDRAANLERAVRRHLADALEDRFADALAAVPGDEPERHDDAPPMTAALATARVASIHAPIVLDIPNGWFQSANAAAAWLDAPLVWV